MGRRNNRFNFHHRKPRSIGGTNDERNLSKVLKKQHVAWHLLFCNMSAQEIAAYINEKWIDPDYILVLKPQSKK